MAFQVVYVLSIKAVRLDTVPIGIETIFMLVIIFFFLYEYSRNINGSYIYNHYCFWIAMGILIYLGGSFFFYILFDQLSQEQISEFGTLTYLAEIVKNLLFTAALFIYSKNTPIKTAKQKENIPYLDML